MIIDLSIVGGKQNQPGPWVLSALVFHMLGWQMSSFSKILFLIKYYFSCIMFSFRKLNTHSEKVFKPNFVRSEIYSWIFIPVATTIADVFCLDGWEEVSHYGMSGELVH